MEEIIKTYHKYLSLARKYITDKGQIGGEGQVSGIYYLRPGLLRVCVTRSFGNSAYVDIATKDLEDYEVIK
jgi:hypothetical protein